MNSVFSICRLLLAVSSFLACVRAQTPPAEAPKPPALRFLFLDETAGAYSVKVGAGTYTSISSTPYAISQPYTPADFTPLEIYKSGTVPDPVTGKKSYTKVAKVTPPVGTSASLVVLTPSPVSSDASNTPAYGVRFFDNDSRSFPPKSLRILNLGHNQMAAQFGGERVLVEPGAFRIIQPATDHYHRVSGKIGISTPAGWKLLYNKMLIIGPDERLTGVFVYSASGLRHTYTSLELAENGSPPPGHFWLTYSESL